MAQDTRPHIEPKQLFGNSRIKFACHKGLSCFTRCCRGIDISLTPYDVIRLKKRLSLPSDEFLAVYTRLELLEKTDLPVPLLQQLDDEEKSCPFVREEGCLIYEDRPSACRYYPVGQGSMRAQYADQTEPFYFTVHEDHCRGYEEDREWTIDEWRADQGVDLYDRENAEWIELLLHKRSFPNVVRLTPEAKRLYFMACFDMDRFRRFVFESRFLTAHKVDEAVVEKIRTDDIELMKFGSLWLTGVFFKQGPYAPPAQEGEKK
ncbi:MAG: YkgJ family cysteine cluster protein [Thermodesulfobacteriota bacterium]